MATTHTKSAGRFECCHQASLHCSLLQSSIRQYMGSWQLHTCILFYSLVCSHSASARSTSPQPDEVLSIVASMVVLGPSPGGWRWQPWCSVEIYVLMALHRWENSFCLAAFTVVTALFFSYMNTTNCSIFSNASCDRFAFSVPTSKKANATVGNAVHVFQAFSFSFPAKE